MFKNGINNYEFGRNILNVNRVLSNYWLEMLAFFSA